MPFPALLIWGGAALAAGVGIKKGLDAKEDFDYAKRKGERAEENYKKAERTLEANREETQQALEQLGKLKVETFTHQIKHLVSVAQQKKNTHSFIAGYDERIFVEEMKNTAAMVEQSLEIEKGLGGAAIGGALSAFGAYGAVGALASASTGTAIAGLSGAAATNATLAWLGGGTLAAGGLGVAGGMVALGGIVLGPALAVGGFYMASKAEEAVNQAIDYEKKVDTAIAEMETVNVTMKGIRTAVAEQAAVIMELAERFEQLKVDSVDDPGFGRMFIIGKSLKDVLMVPVLQDDGTANPNISTECSGYLEIGRKA
ncbi:MAG: hypothetical protein Q3990_00130 [Desulfovibrionaceae bacterium]|nr:hypothetical protein [Desulfovibrionaceae bacterium]